MNDEKAGDDVKHFATCMYCGTHTALSTKRLDRDKPLKCPKCGAPLEVVPPPKRPPKKRKKPGRDYGALMSERYDYGRKLEEEQKIVLNVVIIAAGVLIFIIILVMQKC